MSVLKKKIIPYLLFFISPFNSSFALDITDPKCTQLIELHTTKMNAEAPEKTFAYFTLGANDKARLLQNNTTQGTTQHNVLITNLAELEAKKTALGAALEELHDPVFMLDVWANHEHEGRQTELRLAQQDLPENTRSLWITNLSSDIDRIGNSFLDCFELTGPEGEYFDLTGDTIEEVVPEGYLEEARITNFIHLKKVGGDFFSGSIHLTTIDLSGLSNVTEIGTYFLAYCFDLLQADLSPLCHITKIPEGCLSSCRNLTYADLTKLTELIEIGDCFLDESAITKLDLSSQTKVRKIGHTFLWSSDIQEINLSYIPHDATVDTSENFMTRCNQLVRIINPEGTHKKILQHITDELRESNNPEQQKLGTELYRKYFLKIPADLAVLMQSLNFDYLKTMTPKPIQDLPNMSDLDVVNFFLELGQHLQLDEEHINLMNDHLLPQIRNLFSNSNIRVTWPVRDEQRPEVKIAFKNLVHELQKLMNSDREKEEALTYIVMLLNAFEHCESRYVSELNNVLLKMGVSNEEMPGHEGKIWKKMNNHKTAAFMKYIQATNSNGSHSYGRKFTTINDLIGLPVAVQGFQERISHLSEEERLEITGEFLKSYFNASTIKAALLDSFTSDTSPLSPTELRSLLGKKEDPAIVQHYNEAWEDDGDENNYYIDLAFPPEEIYGDLTSDDPFGILDPVAFELEIDVFYTNESKKRKQPTNSEEIDLEAKKRKLDTYYDTPRNRYRKSFDFKSTPFSEAELTRLLERMNVLHKPLPL